MKHGERLISNITVGAGLSARLGGDKPADILIRNHSFKGLIPPSGMPQTVALTCPWILTVHASLPRSGHKAKTRSPGRRGLPDLRKEGEREAGRDMGAISV